MSAGKTTNAWGFMAKIESVYGTDPTLAGASDGILLAEKPVPDFEQFLFDGARGGTPGGAPRIRSSKGGRFGSIQAIAEAIGGGAAYSASIRPTIDRLIRACGMEATVTGGAGVEVCTYAPEIGPSGLDSLTVEAYLAAQMYKMSGVYGTFQIEADGPVIPRWTFDLMGIAQAPTDVAIPTITYPVATLLPPKATGITLNINGTTGLIVRRFLYNHNRSHDTARANQNVALGHGGFTPGGRNPTLEVTVERTGLGSSSSTISPYALAEAGTGLSAVSLQVGSVQYNKWKIVAGGTNAQIADVTDEEDGPTALWTLLIEFKPTTYLANDEVAIIFD